MGRRQDDRTDAPTPLVILTGFLGAGKTTALNRVLAAQHQRRVAVLVNELGRIDVDAALIRARAGDVLELAGGCVCHQIGVQRELWSALADIIERSRPDVVVLETTGIAEPQAILDGLSGLAHAGGTAPGGTDVTEDDTLAGTWSPAAVHDARRRALVRMVSPRNVAVVTVVDAEAGPGHLAQHAEARAQVVAADRILLSKLDLAGAGPLGDLHGRLNQLNPTAERAGFAPDAAGTGALIPWLLDARPRSDRPPVDGAGASRPHAHGGHAHQLAAATYVDDAPLVGPALLLALEAMGERLVRAKGFVHIAGESRRGIVQRAGGRTTLEFDRAWEDEPRVTRLVLIGEALDEPALQRQLWACRAAVS